MLQRFILFALLAIAASMAPTPSEGQTILKGSRLWLYNNTDSSGVNSTTGIIRYDPLTGKYRFYNALTGTWFSYPLNGGGGGDISLGALNGASKTSSGAALVDDVLYMQTADASFPGLVSTGSQTFAGNKSFSAHVYPASDNAIDLGSTSARWRTLYLADRLGIGATPNAPLQFAQTASNRKIVLRESANNDHEFFGFGHDGTGGLRYQIPAITASHAWFAGVNATTSNELARLTGTGRFVFNTPQDRQLILSGGNDDNHYTGFAADNAQLRSHINFTNWNFTWTTATGPAVAETKELLRLTGEGILRFPQDAMGRKVVLYQGPENNHEFTGIGLSGSADFRYQVRGTNHNHIWYAGTSSTTSNELMRLTGGGTLRMGSALLDEKLSLWKGAGTYQFYGFGVSSNVMRYHVSGSDAVHAWYTSTGDYSSPTVLMQLNSSAKLGVRGSPSSATITAYEDGVGSAVKLEYGGSNLHATIEGPTNRAIRVKLMDNDQDDDFSIWSNNGGASAQRFVVKPHGSVGIMQVPSASQRLIVKSAGVGTFPISFVRSGGNNVIAGFRENNAGNGEMYLYNAAGTLYAYISDGIGTATNWVATSDIRLKNNIKFVGSQLDKVTSIANVVRNYDRTDNGENETGFVAQELYEVAPEYVHQGNDSTMWSVNYSKMVVPLYKAVAELTERLEALEKENAELRKQALDRAGRDAHRERFNESFQEADGEFTRKMKALKKARR